MLISNCKDPDAEQRLKVFREGQIAFRSGAECPYNDWRFSTWHKGWAAAKAYYTAPVVEQARPKDVVTYEIHDDEVELVLEALRDLVQVKVDAHQEVSKVYPRVTEHDFGIPKLNSIIKRLEGED